MATNAGWGFQPYTGITAASFAPQYQSQQSGSGLALGGGVQTARPDYLSLAAGGLALNDQQRYGVNYQANAGAPQIQSTVQPGQTVYQQPTQQLSDPSGGGSPDQLADYWKTHPGTMEEAMRQDPNTWGIDPNAPSTIIGGTPYNAAGVPQTGLIGSEDALRRGLQAGTAGVTQGVNQAAQTLSPYTQGGGGAFNYQAALSGAMGPEAQAQAYAGYMESPGQSYLREMGEQAITRNASATGGLQGGNVLQELQRHGIGLAAQDFNDSFNRLGSLSQMGYGASQALGGIQANAGQQIGNYGYGTGQNLSTGRTRAGEMIAGNVSDTTSSLANLVNQQGGDLSNIIGAGGNNIAQLLQGLGINDATTLQQLSTLLSNNAIGTGTTVAGLPALGQFQDRWNAQESIGNVFSTAGNAIAGMQ